MGGKAAKNRAYSGDGRAQAFGEIAAMSPNTRIDAGSGGFHQASHT
jgi:hypothetical protein